MNIIREDEFRRMCGKNLSGAYLFFGDEDYMKVHATALARRAVCQDEALSLFNEMKIDVMDYSATAFVNALTPLPMMSDKKLVIVNGLSLHTLARNRELEAFFDVLPNISEYDYNVVIISVPAGQLDEGTPKKPSEHLKRLGEYLTLVRFDTYSGSKLVSWVAKHFEHEGVVATPDVCSYLIERSGRSMYALSNETQKLSYYALSQGRTNITRRDVDDVAVAEISIGAYDFANAIMDGRTRDAMDALYVLKFQRIQPNILMAEVTGTICDLVAIKKLSEEGQTSGEIAGILGINEYRVKIYSAAARGKSMSGLQRALRLCTDADRALKNSGFGYSEIEKLICSL